MSSARITEDQPPGPNGRRESKLRVLMLGWEFPPFISGGLGTACHGLSAALAGAGAQIVFVLPRALAASKAVQMPVPTPRRPWRRAGLGRVVYRSVPSAIRSSYPGHLHAHHEPQDPQHQHNPPSRLPPLPGSPGGLRVVGAGSVGGYGGNLLAKTRQYAQRCVRIAADEPFDLVHAHDWMTFQAGQAVAARFNKPLIAHVHATEFDRSGEHVNQTVYDLERQGVHAADRVIAVSARTRDVLTSRYALHPDKVHVVHNGMAAPDNGPALPPLRPHRRNVLFLGRLTQQKGPGFFISAARRVLEHLHDARFIIAGTGDMLPAMVERVAENSLGARILFTGFLDQTRVAHAYRHADAYVMPSVSEPFGLTALEAVRFGTPAIVSKTSGAAEVLTRGALKVDHWDVDAMANAIIAVLRHPALAQMLRTEGLRELRPLTWEAAAEKCALVYRELQALCASARTASATEAPHATAALSPATG